MVHRIGPVLNHRRYRGAAFGGLMLWLGMFGFHRDVGLLRDVDCSSGFGPAIFGN